MQRLFRSAACLIAFHVACTLGAGEVRTWTDSTGKHKTEAEFVSFKDGVVTLRKPGTNKTLELPLERLSDADQEFVDDLLREQEQAEKERTEQAGEADKPASPSEVTAAPASTPARSTPPAGSSRRPPNNVINSVRGAVYRAETMNKMKQIALAVLNYESSRMRYPTSAIMAADGKPGLSWRVAILPMLEENGLYQQFKLNEPWDSPHNKPLAERMPAIFQSPGSDLDSGYTNYLAVVSPDTIISSGKKETRIQDVRDGTSRTVMIVEADDEYAAIWTKPDDYVWDPAQPAYGLGHIWAGIFFVGFGDGAIGPLDTSIGNDQLNAYFSRSGGEVIE